MDPASPLQQKEQQLPWWKKPSRGFGHYVLPPNRIWSFLWCAGRTLPSVARALVFTAALAVVLAVAPSETRSGGGTATSNVRTHFRVLAHVDPGGGYSADVYGHRSYAYLSSRRGASSCPSQGVRVYDLRDPRRPALVSVFASGETDPDLQNTDTNKTIVQHVETPTFNGELAATTIKACARGAFTGFGLWDVTNPSEPTRLALVPTGVGQPEELWLQPVGDRAFVYPAVERSEASPSRVPDFRIYDASDPRHPRMVSTWGARSRLGVNDREAFVHSVRTNAAATRAYLSYWNLGTIILDISHPAQPRYLARTTGLAGQPAAHSSAVSANDRLLIETHEYRNGAPTIFSLANDRRPRRLATFRLSKPLIAAGRRSGSRLHIPLGDSVHDPKVLGSRAFFSWYRQGVVAAEISNPRRPRFLARFLPPPASDPEQFLCTRRCTAVWGVYPTEDYVLASDMVSGLWVLTLED
jgi:hypothetical protein